VLEDLVRHPGAPEPAGAVAPLLARLADALPGAAAGDGGDGGDPRDRPGTERRPPAASQVRLPFERIDSLVRLASELLVERSTLEQAHRDLQRQTGELTFTLRRLRGLVDRLESGAEAAALLGVRTSAAGVFAGGGLPGSGLAAGELAGEEFDALEMDRYTELHVLARGLAEVVSDAETAGAELTVTASDLDGVLVRQRRLVRDLQDGLLRLRTVPLATLAGRLHRTARVAAERSGKQVELTFEGEAVELDKGLLEAITDSFLHLVRNAVAHGIETPGARRALGKPERGQVRVTGRIRGGLAVLTIADDGAGIDVAAVRSAAVVRGLLSPEAADTLTDDEARTLIFLPGFSTAATVSEIAGRGVGLDVVQSKVESLRGALALDSEPGRGTRVTLRLPLVLTVLRCLFVRVAGQPFALPAAAVLRVERIERSDLRRPDAGRGSEQGSEEPILVSLGEPLPVRALADVLGLPAGETIDRPLALVVDCGEHRAVFLADQLLESREVVVKPLGPLLGRVAGLAGATLLGDGTVVPILDPAALPNPADRAAAAPPEAPGAGAGAFDSGPLQVLIVDDSLSVRRVLSNLALKAGWIPHTARDGREALEALQQLPRVPDAILLDIEMPRMDGFELAATLRALPTFARVPIILLTSRSGTKHRDKALGLGVSEYLVKPFDPPVLLGLVERLTAARRRAGGA
jgi:chemosensory pili system protein ChpA (sensor histidine kinase/response regulator)